MSRRLITGSNATYNITAGPYEYLLVTFENDFGAGASRFTKGVPYTLPAMYAYMLFNEDTWQAYRTTAEVAVMTGLTFLGVSEVAAAVKARSALGLAAGLIDMGIGIGDIVVNVAFRNEIKDIYPDLADNFDKIAMCYALGRLVGVGLKAVFRKAYIEARIAQYDLRLSQEAKITAGKIGDQLQKPENFAEFIDNVSDLAVELNRSKRMSG